MTSICAKVNPRLLTKASRLFTGSLRGRIIEILQNARRAGATHVQIVNQEGVVTVRDNGRGIDDFSKLLDLGGSGWEESLEASEDPAGVGLFCLAPRELSVRSGDRLATVHRQGWTGAPVLVLQGRKPLAAAGPHIRRGAGTELRFGDEPWTPEIVEPYAVFTGLKVTVDGEACPAEPFIRGKCAHHADLGLDIQVLPESELSGHHRMPGHEYGDNVLVNFHGQVVAFSHHPVSIPRLHYLVNMTGQPTGIRLMLPARTCLVEDEAFAQLKAVLEREAYLYVQRQARHTLPYAEFERAKKLCIELPEADPVYRVGLLHGDGDPEPVEVAKPDDLPLDRCYTLGARGETDHANAHLLAAIGTFDRPFVPVEIDGRYDGYSWARLPTIQSIKLSVSELLQKSCVDCGYLVCFKSITLAASCSDGRTYQSEVCMAIRPPPKRDRRPWCADPEVYVTPEAGPRISAAQLWYHFGGFNEEGDTYDTQEYQFSQALDAFWTRLVGPYEPLRVKLMDALNDLKRWRSVTILPSGQLIIRQSRGADKIVAPPRLNGKEVSS